MKTSLEVEYWVVDDDGDLVPPDTLLDVSAQIDPEFVEPMLELKTTPCASMDELRAEFTDLLDEVLTAAHERGKRLVPLATPLTGGPAAVPYREKRTTELQRRIVGPAFEDARVCAGMHVHFEQSNVVSQLNALTAIDPAFALLTSSSHYRGERIVAAARPYLYRRSCYAACPDQGQLWPYVDSVAEWERRLEDAHAGFRERALDRGVDPDDFDEAFDPYDAVWTPVRLRQAFPTVEWRSPDTSLPSQVLRLASEVRSILQEADERGTVVVDESSTDATADGAVPLPAFDTVEDVTDRAIRDGLDDPAVQRYLRTLGFTPSSYDPLVDRLPTSRLTNRQGNRLRLRAASRLETDLERAKRRVRA